jgi:hypothetical protein
MFPLQDSDSVEGGDEENVEGGYEFFNNDFYCGEFLNRIIKAFHHPFSQVFVYILLF